MDTWILSKCRRVCLHRLLAWTALALSPVGVAALSKTYLIDFFQGPYRVSESELAVTSDPDAMQHNFVRIVGSKIIDTGLRQVEVSSDSGTETKRVTAGYYVLRTGERLLLVKASSAPSLTVDGSLERLPSDVWNQLFDDAEQKQRLSPYFLHMFLNTESFRLPGYIGLSIGALAIAIAFFYGQKAWRQFRNPSLLLVAQRVERWGDRYRISAEIERALESEVRLKQGSVRLTDMYAVLSKPFKFDVYRVEDLVWAYKRVTRHYYNFIPTGKTYKAVLIFYGGALDVQGTEKKVETILQYFGEKTPWAVFGHTKEINEIFTKDTAGFCQVVEERRRQMNR